MAEGSKRKQSSDSVCAVVDLILVKHTYVKCCVSGWSIWEIDILGITLTPALVGRELIERSSVFYTVAGLVLFAWKDNPRYGDGTLNNGTWTIDSPLTISFRHDWRGRLWETGEETKNVRARAESREKWKLGERETERELEWDRES